MNDTVAEPRKRSGFGVASILLGVAGLAAALVLPTLAFVVGLLGLFLGLVARGASGSRGIPVIGIAVNSVVLVAVAAIAANVFH